MIRRRYYPTLKKTRRPTFRQQVGMSLQRNPIRNYEHTERPTTEEDIKRAVKLVKKANLWPLNKNLGYFNITEEIAANTTFTKLIDPSYIITALNDNNVNFVNFIVPNVQLVKSYYSNPNPLQYQYTLTVRGQSFTRTATYDSGMPVGGSTYSYFIGGFYVISGNIFGPRDTMNNYDAHDADIVQIGTSNPALDDGCLQCVYNETGSSLSIHGVTQSTGMTLLINVILLTY